MNALDAFPEVLDFIQARQFFGLLQGSERKPLDAKTIHRWRRHPVHPLPCCKPEPGKPGRVFFIKADLIQWLRECQEHPTADAPRRSPKGARAHLK